MQSANTVAHTDNAAAVEKDSTTPVLSAVAMAPSIQGRKKSIGEKLHRQRGASSTEFMVWGILAAVVIAGVVGAFYVAQRQQEPKTEAANVIAIFTAAKQARTIAGYANLTTATMQRDGGFPTSMAGATGPGTVSHSWGGAVTVAGTATTFTITYAGVPADRCSAFRASLEKGGSFQSITACSATAPTTMAFVGR